MEKIKIIYDEYLEQFVVASLEEGYTVNLECTENIGNDLAQDEIDYYNKLFKQADDMNEYSLGGLIQDGLIKVEIEHPKSSRTLAYNVTHLEEEVFMSFEKLQNKMIRLDNSFWDEIFKHQCYDGNELLVYLAAIADKADYENFECLESEWGGSQIEEIGFEYSVVVDDELNSQITLMNRTLALLLELNSIIGDFKDMNDFLNCFITKKSNVSVPKKVDRGPIEV